MKAIILFHLMLISTLAISQDFHVTTTGDDGDPGTAVQPWESLQHAMDNATPGSTVYIHQGTYNERLYMNVDGTPGNYITFISVENEDVFVDGSGLTDPALLEMYDVQYVVVEGIKFMNNEQIDAIGILIEGVSDHIRIEDCDISNVNFSTDPNAPINSSTNAQPLIVYGNEASHAITNLEIIDNEIFDCQLGYSEALAINGNVDGFIVSENEVHDVTNIGIDIIGHEGTCSDPSLDQARNGTITDNETYNCLSPYATSAGIYVDGGKDLTIERNFVHHNQWGIEIGCENPGKTTDNIVVRNNFIYANSTAGLTCGGYEFPASGAVTNSVVSNNTFFGNDTENDYTGELYLSYNDGLTVTNNIFYATNGNAEMMSDENLATSSQNMAFYNNLWYHPDGDGNVEFTFGGSYYTSLSAFASGTGFGSNSMFADPLFIAVGANPDLHLTAASPAEDFGNATFSNIGMYDIDMGLRLVDGSIDLGADEIDDQLTLEEAAFENFTVYPNPANDMISIQLDNFTNSMISIYDLNGRLQKTIPADSQTTAFCAANLPAGFYTIVVSNSSKRYMPVKLIKL